MSKNYEACNNYLNDADKVVQKEGDPDPQGHLAEIQRQAWNELSDDIRDGWMGETEARELYIRYFGIDPLPPL